MVFPLINNVTYEGYDFTEEFIDSFSRATLQAGLDNGLLEAVSASKLGADDRKSVFLCFHFALPDDVIGVAQIKRDENPDLLAEVTFVSARTLAWRPESASFDEHSAVAFLQFRFDALGANVVERKLEGARMFVRDGFADQMFVAMIRKENPEALAA